MAPKPVVLAILDGWGLSADATGNAPHLARTPTVDHVLAACPSATLSASGLDVGLPDGQMGNSEVGHITIGAGRTVWMDLPRIDRAIADGSFAENAAIQRFAAKLRETGGTAHLLGLMSEGGVHSHQHHLAEAARVLRCAGIPVALHLVPDGRDTPPESALQFLGAFEADLGALRADPEVSVATVTGRFFAMDRDRRWERVEKAHNVIVHGAGHAAETARAAIEAAYARGERDEFAEPTAIAGYGGVAAGDGLFCTNFRADRVREILGALCDPDFDGFHTGGAPRFAAALCMSTYSDRLDALMDTVFPTETIQNTLGAWVARAGKRQFRLAETEKYPHVTFFLNGGVETPAPGETRLMAPSPKVQTYDLAPEMAAEEVTDRLVDAIGAGYDLIVVNYANPDMVGHSGDLAATIRACEAVDRGLARALRALEAAGGAMLMTADHGNCEMMIDPETGGRHTAHTTNRVPVALIGAPQSGWPGAGAALRDGRLSDIAPTLLQLMGIDPPPEMTGQSLLCLEPA